VKINHTNYIGNKVTNQQLMGINPANKGSRIKGDVYDELPSVDNLDRTDYDKKCKDFRPCDVTFARKSKELLSIGVNYLFLSTCILIPSLHYLYYNILCYCFRGKLNHFQFRL
jgi:hypothetical protein